VPAVELQKGLESGGGRKAEQSSGLVGSGPDSESTSICRTDDVLKKVLEETASRAGGDECMDDSECADGGTILTTPW
jgi:hypothetical protein